MNLRSWLNKKSRIISLKRKIWRWKDKLIYGNDVRICEELPLYTPFSAGKYRARALLTVQAANQIFPFIVRLARQCGHREPMQLNSQEFALRWSGAESRAFEIKKYFDHYGSDKANHHDYHYIYGAVLANRLGDLCILEIGLGTNNRDTVSNMGVSGVPGASARAFRDYLPNALIVGADIDRRILFREHRIETFYVDQTDPETFRELERNTSRSFDLIIDDGLHSPNANIAVLEFGLRNLRPNGWIIIEDIPAEAVPVWKIMPAILGPCYECYLICALEGWVFAAHQNHQA